MSDVGNQEAGNERRKAEDRTLYWTLSFYLPTEKVGKKHPDPKLSKATIELRDAIDPLFNDIADRSSWNGEVEDRMFAVGQEEQLTLLLPSQIRWSTEGRTYSVNVENVEDLPGAPRVSERKVRLRRFWYQHANGAISWHLSFDYFYGEDLKSESGGRPPITYYFLSLLQKLAWPKEFQHDGDKLSMDAEPSTDALVGIRVRRTESGNEGEDESFWKFVERRFSGDKDLLSDVCIEQPVLDGTTSLLEMRNSIEVRGLKCHDCRSLFFIRDSAFFNLIQPIGTDRKCEPRRTRIQDTEFEHYPDWIEAERKAAGTGVIPLEQEYWDKVRPAGDDQAETRLAYLFLAGFNQNIIDFTNQEASEVLDSLDPIYPKSDEQEEEGFFIRYANPRSMITYVKRSRTLEVGNDFIGTCPYAFLIHALAMHNESLTRDQEKTTFQNIESIKRCIEEGKKPETKTKTETANKKFDEAENTINQVRNDAFDVYERNRYHNPFRYDTERDVFDALEQLRGTSRRKHAYEMGLASLEEQTKDLAREWEKANAKKLANHEKKLTILFALLGLTGLAQFLSQIVQYFGLISQNTASTRQDFIIEGLILGSTLLFAFLLLSLWNKKPNS